MSLVLTPEGTPASPVEGEVYYDSTADKLKVRDSSAFREVVTQDATFNGTIGSSATSSSNLPAVKTALNASGNPGIYAVRAWANINGSSSPSIRADGGFSSVGVSSKLFTLNFSTDMGSSDYATLLSAKRESGDASSTNTVVVEKANTYTSGSFKVFCFNSTPSTIYPNSIYVAVIK